MAVHVSGVLRFVDDHRAILAHLDALTDTHESGRAHPWTMSDAPPAFIEQLARAVLCVEIEIVSLEGKWKLSQNRADDDVAGVIAGLQAQPDAAAHEVADAVAAAMATRREKRNSH